MKFKIFTLLILSTTFVNGGLKNPDINTVFHWNQLNFGFPSDADRTQALANGNLVPSNGVLIDVAPHYAGNESPRFYVTVPRFITGIPYSLATLEAPQRGKNVTLQPYPSYEWHSSHGGNCDYITSAFRVAINECNQMWVIDSGVIGSAQICPPQLLLFDLQTNTLIHRYRFDTGLYVPIASLFITPVLDVRDPPPRGRCQNTMVYVADVGYHGLVIYDYSQNAGWRAENKFMYPDPDFGTHTVAGESFTLMDGIFGLSVYGGHLFFHPLASRSEYAVPLNVLNNRTIWENNVASMEREFKALGNRNSECAAEATDSSGNLYCVTLNPIKLLSWNVNTAYKSKNLREIPTVRTDALEFVSGMKVVRKDAASKEELWMVSNRFQKIAAGTQDFNRVNFRVLRRTLDDTPGLPPGYDLSNKLIFN